MNYILETGLGDSFSKVSQEAKIIAITKWGKTIVEFDFNGIKCLVDKDTNLDWLYRDYNNASTMGWTTIGPNCLDKYNKKTLQELEKRTQETNLKESIRLAEYSAIEDKKRQKFETKTKDIEIELSDVDGWNKTRAANPDGYGGAALDYVEYWAKLMQLELSNGKTIAECADKTQDEISFLGITGYQYGCAVSILSQTWKYGKELRKWRDVKNKY